jgi:hypothetical protein
VCGSLHFTQKVKILFVQMLGENQALDSLQMMMVKNEN